MKNLKGGYKIISLQNNDLSSGFTLEGIYEAIASSYGKPILVTDIVISGEKKNDVFTTVDLSSDDYTFTVYGKILTIDDEDAVTVANESSGTTLYLHKISSSNVSGTYIHIVNNDPDPYEITFNMGTIELSGEAWSSVLLRSVNTYLSVSGSFHNISFGNTQGMIYDSYVTGSPLAASYTQIQFFNTGYTYTDTVTKL